MKMAHHQSRICKTSTSALSKSFTDLFHMILSRCLFFSFGGVILSPLAVSNCTSIVIKEVYPDASLLRLRLPSVKKYHPNKELEPQYSRRRLHWNPLRDLILEILILALSLMIKEGMVLRRVTRRSWDIGHTEGMPLMMRNLMACESSTQSYDSNRKFRTSPTFSGSRNVVQAKNHSSPGKAVQMQAISFAT